MTLEEQQLAELQLWLDAGYTMEELEAAGGYPEAEAAGPKSTIPTETVVKTGQNYEVVKLGLSNGYTKLTPGPATTPVYKVEDLLELSNGGAKMGTNGYGTLPTNGAVTTLKTGDPVYNGAAVSPSTAMNVGIDWSQVLLWGNTVWNLIQQFSGGGTSGETPSTAVVPYSGNGAVAATPEEYGLTGPGIPEPPAGSFTKTWRIETEDRTGRKVYTYFWWMNDRSIVYYSTSGKVGRYKPKKPIATVMPGGKMNMRDFAKLEKYIDNMSRKLAKASKHLVYK